MNCQDAQDLMLLEDSGELTPADARTLAAHRAACRACEDAARSWPRLAAEVRAALKDGAPSPGSLEAIHRVATSPRQARILPFPRLVWLRAAAAAAVAIVLVGGVSLALLGGIDRAAQTRHRERIANLRAIIGITLEASSGRATEAAASRDEELRELAEQLLLFEGMTHEEIPSAITDEVSRHTPPAGWPQAVG